MKLPTLNPWKTRLVSVMLTAMLTAMLATIAQFIGIPGAIALPSPVLLAQTVTPPPAPSALPAQPATPQPAAATPSPVPNAAAPEPSTQPEAKKVPESAPQQSPSGGPYDMQAIQDFYQSLYGS